ncbi:MAG: hypothetical protein ABR915_01960 [Thermoguttaceae bacterium]|jgi:hypothetical protein
MSTRHIQRFESLTVAAAVCIAIVMTTAALGQDRRQSKPGEEKAKTSQLAGKKSVKPVTPNVPVNTVESLERAIRDLIETFGEKYAKGREYLAKLEALKARGAQPGDAELEKLSTEALLANPLLGFEKLLAVKSAAQNARTADFGANFGSGSRLGDQIAIVSPARRGGVEKVVHEGPINSVDLNSDGRRILFSSRNKISEINVDGTGLRTISAKTDNIGQFDACYLPDGKIMFVSTACEQAVPCTGGGGVGNMHVMEADGSGERRLTFDQDHNWHPAVMNDGRVLYLRWEYALDGKEVATADLRAKRLRTDVPQTEPVPYKDKEGPAVPPLPGAYSPAYVALQQYVRRVGYESDMHMFPPAEFDVDTSALVQMLKKGHYNVQLTRDEWERLYHPYQPVYNVGFRIAVEIDGELLTADRAK